MNGKYLLPYGKVKVPFNYDPALFELILPQNPPPPLDEEEMRHRLSHPIGVPPLKEWVREGDEVLIVVSDITRKTGARKVLPLIISELLGARVPEEKVKIIFALGNHRGLTEEERRAIVGEEIADRFPLFDHNSEAEEDLVSFGSTTRGVPVALNRALFEVDKIILTGGITFHYFAGFTGGRKSIVPGLAGKRTIIENHKLSVDFEKGTWRDGVEIAELEGNPLSQDLVEAASNAPRPFIVNTVISGGEIVGLFAGDWIKAHKEGCSFFKGIYGVPVPRRRRLVVASAGGFPKDINFIQSHKALHNAERALSDGGWLILLSACSDGVGSASFLSWFPFEKEAFLTRFRESGELNGQTAFSLALKVSRLNVILVSELPSPDVERMGMIPARSLEEAWEMVPAEIRREGGYIIPEAGTTLPLPEER